MFQAASFAPGRRDGDLVAAGMAQDEPARGGQKRGHFDRIQEGLRERLRTFAPGLRPEGRIRDDQIEGTPVGRQLAERGKDILDAKLVAVGGEAEMGGILADKAGVAGGQFDADDRAGAPAEALESEGAGTGEQIENRGAIDGGPETIEHRLPHQVGGGADRESLRGGEQSASGESTNDTHGG